MLLVVQLHTDKQSVQTAKNVEHIPLNAVEMLVVGYIGTRGSWKCFN